MFLDRAIGRRITAQMAARLSAEARLVRTIVEATAARGGDVDADADAIGSDLGARVTVIDARGTVLGDTDLDGDALARAENHAARPEVRDAVLHGLGTSVRHSDTVAEDMLYVALRVDPEDPARGVIRLAVALDDVRRAREEIRALVLFGALLSAGAAALIGWLVARGPARRLEEMARTASAVASGRPGARAAARGDDEVAALARSLNRMAEDLEERLTLLARERHQLRTVLDGMVEGVLLTDPTGRILLANDAFRRIFDAALPVEGRRPLEVARVPALQEAIDEALRAETPVTRAISLGGAGASSGAPDRAVQASLAAIQEGEHTVGAVAVFHDVTEIQRLERLRRDFVANVSHELRTPLTAIKGYAETLRDGGLRDEKAAAEFVRIILRHADRLRALIEDLLDLASVEQGQARMAMAPVALRDVAAQAESAVAQAARERRHTLSIQIPADLPDVVADRDRLAQVLINLLDNAVKFTPEGGRVTVTAARAGGRVVLSVSDNGVGIPEADLPRVFERFYRVDRSRDRREGGTGLGLAIAKHLVQAMDGTIEVESAPGRGTTFRVGLRLTSPA